MHSINKIFKLGSMFQPGTQIPAVRNLKINHQSTPNQSQSSNSQKGNNAVPTSILVDNLV